MGKWCGLGLALGLGASSLVACSASSTRDESTRSAHSRLEEGYFYLAAPPSGAVGSPFHMSGTMAYSPVDPTGQSDGTIPLRESIAIRFDLVSCGPFR